MAKNDEKAMRELKEAKAELDREYRRAVARDDDNKESPAWQRAHRRLIAAEENVSWWNR